VVAPKGVHITKQGKTDRDSHITLAAVWFIEHSAVFGTWAQRLTSRSTPTPRRQRWRALRSAPV